MNISIEYELRRGMWEPTQVGWRTEVDSWGVMHDLLHHFPGDVGRTEEELATLGAEYYVNHELLAKGAVSEDEIERSELAALATLSRGLEGFLAASTEDENCPVEFFELGPAPALGAIPAGALRIFEQLATEAATHLCRFVIDDENWAKARASFEDRERVLGWIASGYSRTRERFPDQVKIRQVWDKGLSQLREFRENGEALALSASVTDYEVSLQAETIH